MPRGDRTGPQGMGPMTGRAAGYCAGYDVPGYANPMPGRGLGLGRGGRGRRAGWRGGGQDYGWNQPLPAPRPASPIPTAPPIDERAAIEQGIAGLKAELAYLEQRLNQLVENQGDADQ
jgi:hypothetical protein